MAVELREAESARMSFDWRDRRVGELDPALAATMKSAAGSCRSRRAVVLDQVRDLVEQLQELQENKRE